MLCGLAQTLSESCRAYDSIGRMGGEEFLVIVTMRTEMGWERPFERLRARFCESKIPTRSGILSATISIGVARAAADSTVDEILERADAALYRAKDKGRNCVVYAEGDRECES